MSDPLLELLTPYLDSSTSAGPLGSAKAPLISSYLAQLSTLSLSSLTTTEPQSLAKTSQTLSLSLQALSTRSHKSITASSDHLNSLRTSLPALAEHAGALQHAVPHLDEEVVHFTETFSKGSDNALLERRKKAMLLSRNIDRLSDMLELPTLLSSTISSSTITGSTATLGASSSSSTSTNYAAALDLHAHIKRLRTLYPQSPLVSAVSTQAEDAMRGMTTSLIASLKTPSIKLPAAMRTIGWLRRIAPELDENDRSHSGGSEGTFGALFLICRLANLLSMLEALDPLKELADQETEKRKRNSELERQGKSRTNGSSWSGGQQTERFLKRYVEIFREQSFAIISMYKSIFPSIPIGSTEGQEPAVALKAMSMPVKQANGAPGRPGMADPLQPLPSPLATFPVHLVELLMETLRKYLPNVLDRSSKDSLLTQVLYCAGSLGRLGGDFSMALALLTDHDDLDSDEDDHEDGLIEWVEMVKKHRVQAGRLELLASGIGGHGNLSTSSKEGIPGQ
ncbi:MAG: hypothetical protein M1833_002735 [Piccolia ochrophora]|nr:MAG: hypothetical protein M1833_002735 [Piccolia ochrophora]